jgi:ubiquinone biosynthesis protein COQ4
MLMNPLDTLRMLRSFWRLSQDPNRLGEVFAIADRGSKPEILAETARFVSRDPQGARALGEGVRLGPVDLLELKKLADGTLGRVFADHMIENGLDPRAIPVPTYPSGDFRYVKTHLRETHDIWHVVTGFDTDVAGEIGLQAFYLAQLPSRLSAVLIAMAFVHMATKNIEARDPIMNAVLRGWAIGKQARPFFGFEWAKHWGTPLAEVRALLAVDVALHEAKIPEQQPYVYRAAA